MSKKDTSKLQLDKILGIAPLANGQIVVTSAFELPGGVLVSRATCDSVGYVRTDAMCFVPGVILRKSELQGKVDETPVDIYEMARPQ